jgi:hypothetical protein
LSVAAHELDILVNDKDHPVPNTMPILILANKSDLNEKTNINEFTNLMGL